MYFVVFMHPRTSASIHSSQSLRKQKPLSHLPSLRSNGTPFTDITLFVWAIVCECKAFKPFGVFNLVSFYFSFFFFVFHIFPNEVEAVSPDFN